MELGYFAADTLGVTLHQIKDTLIANEVHPITLGPWRMDLSVEVTSDILTGTELGFWVTLAKRIPLYLIVREKECWLFVLDAQKRKALTLEYDPSLEARDRIVTRAKQLKPTFRAVFKWKGGEWSQVEYTGTSTP